MERPRIEAQPAIDRYDHELNQTTASFIGLADALLEHRDPETGLSFVDIVVQADKDEAFRRLQQSVIGQQLLLQPGEQMAIGSDGEYYPVLDAPKPGDAPRSISVRAWGWDDDKVRLGEKQPDTQQHEVIHYDGQLDHTRQIDINMSYRVGSTSANEVITLYGSTTRSDLPHAARHITMMEYAEMGYEGHAREILYDVSEADVNQFMDLVADMVGDQPMSYNELQDQRYEQYLAKVVNPESLAYIKEWVDNSWHGQVMSDLEHTQFESSGVSLAEALISPGLADQAQLALAEVVNIRRAKRNVNAFEYKNDDQLRDNKYAQPWQDSIERD